MYHGTKNHKSESVFEAYAILLMGRADYIHGFETAPGRSMP